MRLGVTQRHVRHMKRPPLIFVGTEAVPETCPRERCGKPVASHFSADPREPGTWSCTAGHGGVLNARPEVPPEPGEIPKGICRRCHQRPVTAKSGRGGGRGIFCDPCILEGRRLFSEPLDKEVPTP